MYQAPLCDARSTVTIHQRHINHIAGESVRLLCRWSLVESDVRTCTIGWFVVTWQWLNPHVAPLGKPYAIDAGFSANHRLLNFILFAIKLYYNLQL